jgi:hypothetical protein
MSRQTRRYPVFRASLALGALMCAMPAAHAQWEIKPTDGSSIKFGFLMQGRADSVDVNVPEDGQETANDLYFRRLRLLAGGKLTDQLSFFFETDSPNLGKANAAGTKGTSDIYIQDFVVTYKPGGDAFNLDFGMLLDPVTYNSNQSAFSLLAIDYGPYSFAWAGPLDTRVGRDYGVRARGYLFGDHLEYRLSLLDGNRGPYSSNDLRVFGRLMLNLIGSQKGLFYTGTTLGTKQLLSVGVSYDTQDDYDTLSFDAFYDQPFGKNGLTLQADWSNMDGGNFLTSLPEQDNLLLEAGFYIASLKLLPFIQYAERDFKSSSLNDQDRFQIGLGYMFKGTGGNLKFSWGQNHTDGAKDTDELWLQLQFAKF